MESMTRDTIENITQSVDLRTLSEIKHELMRCQRNAQNVHTKAIISANIQDIDNNAVLIV